MDTHYNQYYNTLVITPFVPVEEARMLSKETDSGSEVWYNGNRERKREGGSKIKTCSKERENLKQDRQPTDEDNKTNKHPHGHTEKQCMPHAANNHNNTFTQFSQLAPLQCAYYVICKAAKRSKYYHVKHPDRPFCFFINNQQLRGKRV